MTRLFTSFLVLNIFYIPVINAQTWQEWKLNSEQSLKKYDIGSASTQLEKALAQLQKETSDYTPLADSMAVQLSNLYSICQKYEKAVPLLKKIIAAREQGKAVRPEYIHALTNLAAANIFFEAYDSAYLLLMKADSLRLSSDPGNKFLQAENSMAFSRYYSAMGKLDSALICSAQASSLYKFLKDTCLPEFSLAASTSAYLCMQTGDRAAAENFIKEFSDLMTSPFQTYHPYFMESYINYAECLAMKGSLKEARAVYTMYSALINLKLGKDNPLAITCYNNNGYNFLRMDSLDDARKQFTQALTQLKNIGMEESTMYISTKNNEGLSYLLNRQFATADSIFYVCLALAEKKWGRQNNFYQAALYNKGAANSSLNRLDEAARAFIVAGSIYKTKLLNDMSGMPESAQLNMYNMAEIYFQTMPSFLHLHKEYRTDSILLALYNEQSFLKGLISYNQQKLLSLARNSGDSSLNEQLNKWVANRQILSDAYSKNQPRKYTDSLTAANNLIERQMLSRSKYFKRVQNDLSGSYAAISAKLKKDEIAIDFFKYRLFNENWTDTIFYAALIIKPGSTAPVFIDLCTDTALLKLLQPYYMNSLTRNYLHRLYKDPRSLKAGRHNSSDSLYQMVWQPLDKYLLNKTTVYLSPIGLLNLVAFPALPYKKSKLLTDQYKIHRLQHLKSLLINDVDSSVTVKNIELWGAINYNSSGAVKKVLPVNNTKARATTPAATAWAPLPSTKKEIYDIKKIFEDHGLQVRLFKDSLATKMRFISTVNSQPYFLHIATHGFYTRDTSEQSATRSQFFSYNISKSRNPLLRSGLVFAGANLAAKVDSSLKVNSAILSSFDIAAMNLENVRLATLSACETAMGDLDTGEGVFGLQRALKVAGVDKMILTLWQVDDEKTQIFMSHFYKKLVSGISIRTAFTQTQQVMRKAYDPEYWAAFILVE